MNLRIKTLIAALGLAAVFGGDAPGVDYREYQIDVAEKAFRAFAEGAKDVLAVLPTGAGKTVLFSGMGAMCTSGSGFIAHRQELVSQMSTALARNGVRHRVIGSPALQRICVAKHIAATGRSYVQATSRNWVGGVDTLGNLPDTDPIFAQTAFVVTDEAHHMLKANKWGKVRARFTRALGLGVTATPARADGKGLGRHHDGYFDALVEGPTMRQLIDQRFLCDYRVIAPPSDLNMHGVEVGASGEFKQDQVRAAVHKSTIRGDVVQNYLKFAPGKLGVTFAVDVEEATRIAALFRQYGVSAEVVTAKTPDELRASILRRFEAREVMMLVNVDLFGEGFDLPAIEVVIMARPTASFGLYAQQFGRALRLMAGKTLAIIIDHVGNVMRHKLPDRVRIHTLDRREKRARGLSLEIPVVVCLNPDCFEEYEKLDAVRVPEHPGRWCCPSCHTPQPEPADRSRPASVDGDLYEMSPEALAALRGQVEKLDAPPWQGRSIKERGIANQIWRRQEQQKALRKAMTLWGGLQTAKGRDNSEAFRRFFYRFGVDVGTAWTLNTADSDALRAKIQQDLDDEGVITA